MKNRVFLSMLFPLMIGPVSVLAQTAAFTYQGRLLDGGQLANGSYDLRFTLADAATTGNYLASPLTNAPVLVSNGLFAVTLDFGASVFDGSARWLEIGARTNGSLDGFTVLSPRQPLTATPYALYTPTAANAASLSGTLPVAQLTGTVPLAQLPTVVLTNNASGITLNGSFSGNGSGLTNLNGINIRSGTINSNTLDMPTQTQLALAGTDGIANNQYLPGTPTADAMEVGGRSYTYFVDAVNGSDSNSGASADAPLKTIAALTAKGIKSGDSIGLARNSFWREQITITNHNVSVSAYGSGTPPMLDCSDIITNTWTKTGGQTSVYQATVPVADDTGIGWVSVWENSNRLVRATSIGNCDATTNSYFPSQEYISSSPVTIYVHPKVGDNPSTSGKIYEYSARSFGFVADYGLYTNTTLRGIAARRNLCCNGSIELQGQIYDCLAWEGNKHNVIVGPGTYCYNVLAQDFYYPPGASVFVWNCNVGHGEDVTFDQCSVSCTNPPANTLDYYASDAWYGHVNVSGSFGTIRFINPRVYGVYKGIAGEANTIIISGGYISNCVNGVELGNPNVYITNCIFGNNSRLDLQFDTGTTNAVVSSCLFEGSPSLIHIYAFGSGVNLLVEHITFTNSVACSYGSYSGNFRAYYNTVYSPDAWGIVSTNDYMGDYNWYAPGTYFASAAAWGNPDYILHDAFAAFTGQDANAGTESPTVPPQVFAPNPSTPPPSLKAYGDIVAVRYYGDGSGLTNVTASGLAMPTNSPPADPNTVMGWMNVTNGRSVFKVPLYQ
jgi:hypothetical protein